MFDAHCIYCSWVGAESTLLNHMVCKHNRKTWSNVLLTLNESIPDTTGNDTDPTTPNHQYWPEGSEY